ncbi:DUF2189 domain-containing protein [Vibrio sp.]|nr:DUF2189 domain-containing protein [Vibrio sp.]
MPNTRTNSHSVSNQRTNSFTIIPSRNVAASSPFHWLFLAIGDFVSAPFISLFYGLCFAVATFGIEQLVSLHGSPMVIFSSLILLMLVGPFLALGLYDVSWQKEKHHTPRLLHSMKAITRNTQSQWFFAVILVMAMILWMRVATILHALYPSVQGANFEQFIPFLTLGGLVSTVFIVAIFSLSAFSIPMMMERRIDVVTAMISSANAVKQNKGTMVIWSIMIALAVALGVITQGAAMIITMPIIAYATWHGYHAIIKRNHHN